MNAVKLTFLPLVSLIILALGELSRGQPTMAPSPAPFGPGSNDSTTIDQGIAYVLLLVALAITYLVH